MEGALSADGGALLRLEGLHASYGPIVALRAATSWQWQMLAYGLILVLLVFFLPRGIVPALTTLWKRS